MRNDNVWFALLTGAAAGLAGTWAMGKMTTYLYERESDVAKAQENAARGGKSSYETAVEKIARLGGTEVSDEQRQRFGPWLHWALGVAGGAAYGLVRGRLRVPSPARGLAFGSVFWLLMDEAALWAFGLTPGPAAFPWETHARGLAGHLVYGSVTEATAGLLDRAA